MDLTVNEKPYSSNLYSSTSFPSFCFCPCSLDASPSEPEKLFEQLKDCFWDHLFPAECMSYCPQCRQLKCPKCVEEYISEYYCDNCSQSMPAVVAKVMNGKCSHCYCCPKCMAATKYMYSKQSKAYYIACPKCKWNSQSLWTNVKSSSDLVALFRKSYDSYANSFQEIREKVISGSYMDLINGKSSQRQGDPVVLLPTNTDIRSAADRIIQLQAASLQQQQGQNSNNEDKDKSLDIVFPMASVPCYSDAVVSNVGFTAQNKMFTERQLPIPAPLKGKLSRRCQKCSEQLDETSTLSDFPELRLITDGPEKFELPRIVLRPGLIDEATGLGGRKKQHIYEMKLENVMEIPIVVQLTLPSNCSLSTFENITLSSDQVFLAPSNYYLSNSPDLYVHPRRYNIKYTSSALIHIYSDCELIFRENPFSVFFPLHIQLFSFPKLAPSLISGAGSDQLLISGNLEANRCFVNYWLYFTLSH
ncbi:hypothetical protein SJAG_01739 [Schizosaccharomyces japonicus yFS275]|uniref:Dynactin subunit 4 n=1 Tax=Schizosaccharomyces japonicus (strain yFS275 / FY16936) TaxID=402676 RepID=B6JYS1_SCHJY|nr:hypothetical protein SJAG_01739 [Schizosaccharomyces japonicus yFS275]EEB06689.2 hypothetical protein SJAG_01739 [Schizosaccharomyces japonicus yFS275]